MFGVADALISTFGPFLVPAALFVLGCLGYGLLFLLSRRREGA